MLTPPDYAALVRAAERIAGAAHRTPVMTSRTADARTGSALAAEALSPGCAVLGVEPEAGNDGQRSFRSGAFVRIDVPRTVADGAQMQRLGAAAVRGKRVGVIVSGGNVDLARFAALVGGAAREA